jgi:hypothetical protein
MLIKKTGSMRGILLVFSPAAIKYFALFYKKKRPVLHINPFHCSRTPIYKKQKEMLVAGIKMMLLHDKN